MKRNGTKLIIPTIFMILSLFSSIGITFAWWFVDNMLVSNVTGKTPPSYFAFGDGSEEDPYGISSPVHLYNLAWLQYLGQFNNPEEQKQYHFVVDKDIDMTGLVLPPIGTTDNPFIGSFDGRDHLISNLTVSNTISADGITKYPSGIASLTGVDIVGMFGVVGNYNDVVNYEYDSSLIDVSNLYLDKITVKSAEENSLMGLLFGYINEGDATNIDIGQGNLEVAKNVKPLDSYTNISKYSIIGDFNEANISWTDKPQDTVTPEPGAGWGGSIDMKTFVKRLNYIFSESETRTSITAASSSTYNTNLLTPSTYGTNSYTYDNSSFYFDLRQGTYLPLNINKEIMIDNAVESEKNITYGSSKLKTVTNSYYSTNSSEIILPTNTGYIIGGATNASNASIRTRSQKRGFLAYSYGVKYSSSYDPGNNYNNVDILTIRDNNGSAQYNIISDEYNQNKTNSYLNYQRVSVDELGFHNYESVRNSLGNLLNQSMISGIRFYKGTTADSSVFIPNTSNMVLGNVSLLGKTYTNYPMFNASIMFKTSSSGYLTFVSAGIQQSGTTNYSLFDIYKITRNSSNEIDTITKIDTIHKTPAQSYVYNSANPPAGSTKIFDSKWMANVPFQTALCYMEIPLISNTYPAEFALCGSSSPDSQKLNGSYIMYLDIGSSGDSGIITPPTETPEYTIDSVQFIDSIPSDRSAHPALLYVTFMISKDQTTTLVNVYFKRESNELMLYYVDPSNGLTIAASVVAGVTTQTDNTITF